MVSSQVPSLDNTFTNLVKQSHLKSTECEVLYFYSLKLLYQFFPMANLPSKYDWKNSSLPNSQECKLQALVRKKKKPKHVNISSAEVWKHS